MSESAIPTTPACPRCALPLTGPVCARCGAGAGGAATGRRILTQTRGDIIALWPLLVAPFRRLGDVPLATRRTIALVSAAGVIPLAILVLFSTSEVAQYWGLALYFSLLWAGFFAAVYRTEGVRAQIAVGTYFFTGIVAMPILLAFLRLGFERLRDPFIASPSIVVSFPSAVLFIGVVEEATKALALFCIARFFQPMPPLRVFVFYGLMSGLGFGIYEGIGYQVGTNVQLVNATGDIGAYYIGNVLRLTSAPFFHAVWTAIAAFLIWFGFRFPKRRLGFFTLAIGVPAVLHGTYDSFLNFMPIVTVAAAVVSVGILSVYVASPDRLERDIAPIAELDDEATPVEANVSAPVS